ncbi:hypothetical protein EMIT0162MI3_10184 [Pseudomonas chlororaphis]
MPGTRHCLIDGRYAPDRSLAVLGSGYKSPPSCLQNTSTPTALTGPPPCSTASARSSSSAIRCAACCACWPSC